ncbi:two-component system, response regulator YesN [Lachnospiraceae bacterium KH1T2]|nr:two-component system, response regulator YesN [Lachnospiraceae bacterium KH1T2]
MSLYSCMLVDDEEDVISIIEKKLNWEEMGFKVIGSAHNGVEALELAEEMQPDVVMTDIKMPYMDGLQLAHKLKDLNPKIKIIIFSGFDEFEYAKEAIRVEAEEYLLKPVNSEELESVFERIKTSLDEERNEEQNIDQLEKYYMESLPILQESFLTLLLQGQVAQDSIASLSKDYRISLDGPFFTAVLLHISSREKPAEIDKQLLTVSVRKLLQEEFAEKWNAKVVTWFGDAILIVQLDDKDKIRELTDDCDRFCRVARKISRAMVTAGIGNIVETPSDLSHSLEGAQNAVNYRVIYGVGRAINIAEIDPVGSENTVSIEEDIQRLFRKIRTGSEEEVLEEVGMLSTKITDGRPSIQQYRMLLLELVSDIYRFGNSCHLNMEEIFGKDNDVYSSVLSIDSVHLLSEWMKDISLKMRGEISNERQSSTRSFVKKAEEYVKENFGDKNMTIESVCSHLGVSSAYFSTVFKKETGKTFINFLTEKRMEKAVDLLVNQNEKTYIIAEAVGYSDANYFSYAFKKQFGMSPSKYKAMAKNEKS